jgi:hypothetical protein
VVHFRAPLADRSYGGRAVSDGTKLDPLTLRVVAARMESVSEVQHHRGRCSCVICAAVRELCATLAAEFRTQAIRAELAVQNGPTTELPIVGNA